MSDLSPRLRAVVQALPLEDGMRVLEIGGGPGAAARAVAHRLGGGHVLMIDRSARSIAQARAACADEIAGGLMTVRQAAIEEFVLAEAEAPFDLAFAVRVGALDGRHPNVGRQALRRLASALTPTGRLYVDGGDPLRAVEVPRD